MAIVTTYVCDVTGKSGTDKAEFVQVTVRGNAFYKHPTYSGTADGYSSTRAKEIVKLVHIDVAEKLGLIAPKPEQVEQPEVTFEGKLKVLLEDLVQEIVDESLANR